MIINFPRGVKVDLNHVPINFDDMIRKSFAEYTECTDKDYTYQDKLAYIDLCRQYLHNAKSAEGCVMELMKDRFAYEVNENGEFPDAEDFLTIEFMSVCYEAGRTNLHAHYTGDHHIDDKIMQLLVRAISVVMAYDEVRWRETV